MNVAEIREMADKLLTKEAQAVNALADVVEAMEKIEFACNQQIPRSHLGGFSTSEFARQALAKLQEIKP